MAGVINLEAVKQILLPTKRTSPQGTSYTNTFNPSSTQSALSLPTYRSHLDDIFTSRTTNDSRALIKDLVKFDSDMSATLHAYLTLANTTPRFYVYDQEDALDREGMKQLQLVITSLFTRTDYTTGFKFVPSLREIAEDLRYMVLLRGGMAAELVFNKLLLPAEIRHVDVSTLEWYEAQPGLYKPQQRPPGASTAIPLDIPNFFVKYYRQNPTEIYPESIFVSAINTIAARQQVINDLYRIMQKTGYPRLEITVVEEVLRKSAPAELAQNPTKMSQWINTRISEISTQISDMRSDTAFVHTDAIEPSIMNEGGPGKSMDVKNIIDVLNAQNQASLKTVATIIGRGESGVNTASVEARVFSMSADALNGPIADFLSDMLTYCLRLTGYLGRVQVKFDPAELRPATELEPQLSIRQSRLLTDLSHGIITDDEYHTQMYGRPRPDSAPELSGTNFQPNTNAQVDASKVSPNSDPLGRSITSEGSSAARSNSNKSRPK